MSFSGFQEMDFQALDIDGLEPRMKAIQERIQPKFREIGETLAPYLTDTLNQEMYIHIARHARRTKNPPNDTWTAFSHQKRGYKKHPHFQVGLWNDRVFVWLAFIYELPNKKEIAELFSRHQQELEAQIPNDYVISMDHMKKDTEKISSDSLSFALDRFNSIKKSELLIGKQYDKSDPLVGNGKAFVNEVKAIFLKLTPIYQLAFKIE